MNNAPVVNEEFAITPIDIYGNAHFDKLTAPEFTTHNILTILQDEDKSFKDEPGDTSLRYSLSPPLLHSKSNDNV
jgi:hypothetical protein